MTGGNTAEPFRRQRSRSPEGSSRKYGTRDLISNPSSNPFAEVGREQSPHRHSQRPYHPQEKGSWDRRDNQGFRNQRRGKPYEHRDNGRGRGRGGGWRGNRGHRGASNQYRDRGGQRGYGANRNENEKTSLSHPQAESSRFWGREPGIHQDVVSIAQVESLKVEDKPTNADMPVSLEPGPSQVNSLDSHQGQGVGAGHDSGSPVGKEPTQGTPPPWPVPHSKQVPSSSNYLGKTHNDEKFDMDDEPKVEGDSRVDGKPQEEGDSRVEGKPQVEDKPKVEDVERMWEQRKTDLEGRMRAKLEEEAKAELEERVKAELEKRVKAHDAERALWEQEKISMDAKLMCLKDIITQRDSALEESERSAAEVGIRSMEWEDQCRSAKLQIECQQMHIKDKELELEYYNEAISGMRQELEQTKQLLDARTEENKVAQAYMTTADHYSIADISRMVDQLNDEIFQCAMDMSDALTQYRESPPSHTSAESDAWKPRFEEACNQITEIWEVDSVLHIQAGVERNDPILFECLAQTLFVYRCREVIQRFCATDDIDWYLQGLWDHIFDSREMPIAKNWLAITNSALKQRPFEDPRVMHRLVDLLVVAGWRPNPGSPTLEESIRAKLTEITAKAIKIREVISEGVLSAHIEVFCFDMGDRFDSQHMQDAYDVSGKGSTTQCHDGEVLVCTTGLGLRCISSRSSSSNTTGGERKREIVLKAKVVIQSAITSP